MAEFNRWVEDLYNGCIIIKNCPQCGTKLVRIENLYFPDRDTYTCKSCKLSYTQIVPGEMVITHQIEWSDEKDDFIYTK